MKASEILREAAHGVENGRNGLFSSMRYEKAEDGYRAVDFLFSLLPPRNRHGKFGFVPYKLASEIRSTILCLAAAIAESDGD